jgi:choline dehydrogenase
VKSAKKAGYPTIDLNGGKQIGISFMQQNTLKGWRITSAKAYLEPVAYRENLHVLPQSKATRLIMDKGNEDFFYQLFEKSYNSFLF